MSGQRSALARLSVYSSDDFLIFCMFGRRLALATGLALATRATMATSLHTYSGKTIAGGSLSMESLAGKPVIMLNVASR